MIVIGAQDKFKETICPVCGCHLLYQKEDEKIIYTDPNMRAKQIERARRSVCSNPEENETLEAHFTNARYLQCGKCNNLFIITPSQVRFSL